MELRLKTIFKAFNDTMKFTVKCIFQTMYANLQEHYLKAYQISL